MANARKKGHGLELNRVKAWKKIGYTEAMTSRYGSRYEDDVNNNDIINIGPFRDQCKAVENLGPVHAVLASMKEEKGRYNIVSHKRNNQGTVISMWESDFMELIEMLKVNKIL